MIVLARWISTLITLYQWILIGRVLISWIDPHGRYQISRWLYELTEPVLAPLRRYVPPFGGLDLTPFIAFLLLDVLERLLWMVLV